MKGFPASAALLLAALFATKAFGQGESIPDTPCPTGAPEPAPAYPLPVHSANEIAALFTPPRTNAELLSNLKIVLEEQLLAQPAFFDDEVLRAAFNTSDIQWVKPGTPGVASERVTKPTRIARIRFDAGSRFAGFNVDVGVNHKCLGRRAHPFRPDAVIPAHTYDSGYIYIHPNGPATLTVGEVQRVFGSVLGELPKECRSPLSLHYPGPPGPSREAFRLHAADFLPSALGYPELCRAASDRGLPAEHPIDTVWIRLVQEDYTLPYPFTH